MATCRKIVKDSGFAKKRKSKAKSNVKAIVTDEAHFIVEWKVFDVCFYSFLLLQC